MSISQDVYLGYSQNDDLSVYCSFSSGILFSNVSFFLSLKKIYSGSIIRRLHEKNAVFLAFLTRNHPISVALPSPFLWDAVTSS